MITIRSFSSLKRFKFQNVTKQILGIDLESGDILIDNLDFKKNLNIDSNYMVPIKNTEFKSSTIKVMFDHDFTEKYYEIQYFDYWDILAIIGGLNASIKPLMSMASSLFIINFLYQLAKLILGKYDNQYKEELVLMHAEYRSLFGKVDL